MWLLKNIMIIFETANLKDKKQKNSLIIKK